MGDILFIHLSQHPTLYLTFLVSDVDLNEVFI